MRNINELSKPEIKKLLLRVAALSGRKDMPSLVKKKCKLVFWEQPHYNRIIFFAFADKSFYGHMAHYDDCQWRAYTSDGNFTTDGLSIIKGFKKIARFTQENTKKQTLQFGKYLESIKELPCKWPDITGGIEYIRFWNDVREEPNTLVNRAMMRRSQLAKQSASKARKA